MMVNTGEKRKKKLLSGALLCFVFFFSHGRTSVGGPERNYLDWLYTDRIKTFQNQWIIGDDNERNHGNSVLSLQIDDKIDDKRMMMVITMKQPFLESDRNFQG